MSRSRTGLLDFLAFYLKQTKKLNQKKPPKKPKPITLDNSLLYYYAGRKVWVWSDTVHLPRVLQIFTVIMPNIFVLSPEEHSQHSKAPFSWMVSVHLQFKGIQVSKLGQFKTCLLKIISFWVSDYEPGFCSHILQQREKYALSRKKKVRFISLVRPFSFPEGIFLSNIMSIFNQKMYSNFPS